MVVVLIGKLQLESVGKDITPGSLCARKQVTGAPKDQRLRRHCGWGEGDIAVGYNVVPEECVIVGHVG